MSAFSSSLASLGGRGPGKIEVIMFFSRGAIFRVSLCFWQAVGSPVQSCLEFFQGTPYLFTHLFVFFADQCIL